MKTIKDLLEIGQTANLTSKEFVRLISSNIIISVESNPNDNFNGYEFKVQTNEGWKVVYVDYE